MRQPEKRNLQLLLPLLVFFCALSSFYCDGGGALVPTNIIRPMRATLTLKKKDQTLSILSSFFFLWEHLASTSLRARATVYRKYKKYINILA